MTDAWKTARERWPRGTVPRDAFERRLAELSAAGGEVEFPADLYWATCCLAGEAVAVAALEQTVAKQLSRRGLEAHQRDELAREAMAQLVVGGTERRPKLTQYSGRAPLDGWVHVVVTRLVLDARRAERSRGDDEPLEDAMLGASGEELPAEVELAREKFRGAFAAAFRAALATLEPKVRLMLRQHYLDGVSLEALAKAHGAGRSTVARWLQAARQEVMVSMRDEVRRRTGLKGAEMESLLRVVQSRLELTMSVFREG